MIEVGARTGAGTILLSGLANHVFYFEPARFSFQMLKQYTRKLRNVALFNYVVGEQSADRALNLPFEKDYPYIASVKKLLGYRTGKRQKARMVKLDDFDIPLRPTSLVIDCCEGQQAEVLKGARNLLPSLRSLIVKTHVLSDGTETSSEVESNDF